MKNSRVVDTKSIDDGKDNEPPPPLMESSPSSPSSSSSSPPTSSSSSSLTTTASILTKSRQEFWNTRLSPGGWLDGFRKWCIDPTIQFWSILLAPVQQYKFLDVIIARVMQICFIIPSLTWSLAFMVATSGSNVQAKQQEQDNGNEESNARFTAKQNLLLQASPTGPSSSSSSSSSSSRLFMITPPSDFYSALQGAMAFMITATTDLFGAMLDSHRMNKWWQAIQAFNNYLYQSGMSAHLQESIMKPLWHGRLFCNIKILNDIQEEMRLHDELLEQNRLDSSSRVTTTTTRSSSQQQQPKDDETAAELLKEAGRMMRFATAAYGRDMIASAIDREVSWQHMNTEKKAILVHTGLSSLSLSSSSVVVDDTDIDDLIPVLVEGHGMSVLRHFIAIDKTSKSVILAIRGTLDLSGALVDVQGMDCEFHCLKHGRAHQGIAEQAENIWQMSGHKLQEMLLNSNNNDDDSTSTTCTVPKDYRLIITGHSLGAGAACLLHLKIHAENLFPGRTVVCYGFAPPPTFALQCPPEEEEDDHRDDDCNHSRQRTATTIIMSRQQLQKAMDHSYCFIHDNDCVPFLSVASVRRLSTLLDTVDNHTEHLWFWQRFQIFWELTKIPPNITQAVHSVMKQSSSSSSSGETDPQKTAENDATTTTTTTTATREQHPHVSLMIPASTVIWMKKQTKDNSFQAFKCCPASLAQLDIFMCPDMLSDHLPEQYEDALDALNETTATTAATTTTATTNITTT